MSLTKSERRQRIKFRIRKIVSGTAAQPRLSVSEVIKRSMRKS